MSIGKIHSIHCDSDSVPGYAQSDRCDGWIANERNAPAARRRARLAGWERVPRPRSPRDALVDLCPPCVDHNRDEGNLQPREAAVS